MQVRTSPLLEPELTQSKGEICLIPRITLSPNETKLPFELLRRQFPVRVCYAMTINKSQGQSLKRVGLDLRHPVFGHGQLYVGLSRASDPAGLKVLTGINEKGQRCPMVNVVFTEIFDPA